MIKGLTTASKYTVVSSGNTSVPYVNQNLNNPIQGMLRISGSDLQVFDGTSWIVMNTSYATVGLTGEAESLLDWAREKRNEELRLKTLAEKHPTVADAVGAVEQAKTNLKIITELVS